jgi:hypothetical protein
MITSPFIRFGKDTNAIYNIAHIVSVEPVTAVHAIKVTTIRGSIEYALKTKEIRDATYKKITAILAPYVVEQAEAEGMISDS